MNVSKGQVRKVVLWFHLVSIGLWMLSSVIILAGAALQAEIWIEPVYKAALQPTHMAAMGSGLILLYISRGKLMKKPWFIVKAALLLASILFMNLRIAQYMQASDFGALVPSLSLYFVILLSVLFVSMKKPRSLSGRQRKTPEAM